MRIGLKGERKGRGKWNIFWNWGLNMYLESGLCKSLSGGLMVS